MRHRTFMLCMAGLIAGLTVSSPVSATIIGDPIDHATPMYHGPGGEFFTGPGAPNAPLLGGLGVDISTGFALPTWDYIVVYDFFGTNTSGLAFLETHDLEWMGFPGATPSSITVWGTSGAAAGYLGGNAGLTTHDVDGSGFGFDVHIDFMTNSLVPNSDMFVIAFNDPFAPVGTGGSSPPAGFSGLTHIDTFTIPTPSTLLMVGIGILGVRRRHH